jgi:tocopherol O-methyltransferase
VRGLKASIREHYDRLSPVYRDVWGIHIHHGYWIDGTETKERAQEHLIEHLVRQIGMLPAARVLDIGCGIGGTAIYLAERFDAQVLGITISPVQAAMAMCSARESGVAGCTFAAMDAEEMALRDQFDMVCCVEALSHMTNRDRVLEDAIGLLKPGGKLGIIDWFKQPGIGRADETAYLGPLEKGMLVHHLDTIGEYAARIQSRGCHITAEEDLTNSVAKTWDICSTFTQLPALWRIAKDHGPECIRFFETFRVMRAALRAGIFRYGLIAAEKL